MSYDDEVYDKLLYNFELLCNIIRPISAEDKLKVDLSKISDIINKKLPDVFKDNAPEDIFELYTDFKSEYEKFRDFILYDKLIGKNIVALGGGFSSGKSSFLNALMGKRVLPENIDPSTSVPTYIVKGDEHEVTGINVFDAKVTMNPSDIRKIAHGFGEVEDEDDVKVTDEVTLGHILDNIFFSTPFQRYDNIAFLDTPGYSKPDSEDYTEKTDEQIARGQLNSSNYILWFVQADAGTITEADIKFIKTLRVDIPKLIIINKADKKNLDDLKLIINKVKDTLTIKGVRAVDVFAFSKNTDQIEDEDLQSFIKKDTEKILSQIEVWNEQIYKSNFAHNFKDIFTRCKEYYDENIEEERNELSKLNIARTRLELENISDIKNIIEPIDKLISRARSNIKTLENTKENLKEVQDKFFSEIKIISDIVGIDMPEPSEIDLIKDDIPDISEILESYKKANNITTDPEIKNMLEEIFIDANPVFGEIISGKKNKENMVHMLKELFNGIEPKLGKRISGSIDIEYKMNTKNLCVALNEIQKIDLSPYDS